MTTEEFQRLYELYMSDRKNNKLTPSIRDFMVWVQEEGYDYED